MAGFGSDYNTKMSYNGHVFWLKMTSFSYGWNMAVNGRSQGKRRYTSYPYRRERGNVTATFQFRSPYSDSGLRELYPVCATRDGKAVDRTGHDEWSYQDFEDYIWKYMQAAVDSKSTATFPVLRLQCGKLVQGGAVFSLIPTSMPMSFSLSDAASACTMTFYNVSASNVSASSGDLDIDDLASDALLDVDSSGASTHGSDRFK